jgi:hypothetical protein
LREIKSGLNLLVMVRIFLKNSVIATKFGNNFLCNVSGRIHNKKIREFEENDNFHKKGHDNWLK